MTHAEIYDEVVRVLRERCAVTVPIEPSSTLQTDLGLDSAGLLNLALEVENAFQLMLEEPPESPPETVAALVDLLAQRLAEEGRS
jgi:acyl carrier protein